jgi:thioredoxin reductase (NADPH)
MTSATPLAAALPAERQKILFPTLSDAQSARIAAHGNKRRVRNGEVLIEQGEQATKFFVVASGEVEIVRPTCDAEELVAIHHAGQFLGEINLLAGRRSLARARVREAGEVIELSRDRLLALVQTDSELSEILMRAFIMRRVELISQAKSDVALIGSNHSSDTLRIKEFLSRNGYPYSYIDLEHDSSVQEILDHFQVGVEEIPVLICRGETVLRNPSNQQVADCLGFNVSIDPAWIRDVVVVGAGPSGLAAAVYAASEGLNALVVETHAPGGQAGSSSKIENYLGFPTGISGQELAGRAFTQAQKFGAEVMIARSAVRLTCDRKPYSIEIEGGTRIQARTVVIATGAQYRKLPLLNLARFEGNGVYYSATFMEAQLCDGEEIIVVGGGNAAGQAAVFLAHKAKHVHLLVRSDGLADTMSRYLIRRIEEHPAISLRAHTEVAQLEGNGRLEHVVWRNNQTGEQETRDLRHVFIMTGAAPNTRWLGGCIAVDDKGFIKTGRDLQPEELTNAGWPLARQPYLLETSRPGVFAVGDVRFGNIKRVASAVGEGSAAINMIHQVLQE